jgi:hypothetical protein
MGKILTVRLNYGLKQQAAGPWSNTAAEPIAVGRDTGIQLFPDRPAKCASSDQIWVIRAVTLLYIF